MGEENFKTFQVYSSCTGDKRGCNSSKYFKTFQVYSSLRHLL